MKVCSYLLFHSNLSILGVGVEIWCSSFLLLLWVLELRFFVSVRRFSYCAFLFNALCNFAGSFRRFDLLGPNEVEGGVGKKRQKKKRIESKKRKRKEQKMESGEVSDQARSRVRANKYIELERDLPTKDVRFHL